MQDLASAARAYYNTKTDEHILRICKVEILRYIVFHEFDAYFRYEMYAKQDSWNIWLCLVIQNIMHAELMIMLGAKIVYKTQDFHLQLMLK